MKSVRRAVLAQGVVRGLQRSPCGQHRVDQDQVSASHARRPEVFDFNVEPSIVVLPVGRHKRRIRLVPHVQHPLMKRHGGPKDAGQHGLRCGDVFSGFAEWGLACRLSHLPGVRQGAAQFPAQALHVPPEGGLVLVGGRISKGQQELPGHAGVFIQNAHGRCHAPKVHQGVLVWLSLTGEHHLTFS